MWGWVKNSLSAVGMVASAVTALYKLKELYDGDTSTVTLAVGCIAALALVVALLYLAVLQLPALIRKHPKNSMQAKRLRWCRLSVFGVLAVTAVGAPSSAAYIYHRETVALSGKFVLVVAKFAADDDARYRVTEEIVRTLRTTLAPYPDAFVRTVPVHVTELDEQEKAAQLADRYRGNAIIWGYYGATQTHLRITLSYENLTECACVYAIPFSKTELIVDTQAANDFKFQEQLARRVSAIALLNFASERFKYRDYQRAMELTDRALQFDVPPALRSDLLAQWALASGQAAWPEAEQTAKLNEALRRANEAMRLKPEGTVAQIVAGSTLYALGRNTEAVELMSRVVAVDEKNAFALVMRALAYKDLGNRDLAILDLRRVHEMKPKDTSLGEMAKEELSALGVTVN